MKIEIKAKTETCDDVVHHVFHDDKRVGFIIKTENKNMPFTIVDIQGDSGNAKNLEDAVKRICLKHIALTIPKEERADFMAVLIAMKLCGEL
ncbi:hypothetical protein [Citrobacter braakii]|uniref:Uncharacterized protein n=1 Tax=Citrobacter braakii TaxID=57706 RepID=A0A1V8NS37_CITBR|nr:hypothetical protein [Citrobacter braakii]OQM39147.1 hypothetical protein BZK42_26510 [Citrobacter braakii]QXC18453.1 hypothetical protein I6L51_10495 [Citrobacter braakii]